MAPVLTVLLHPPRRHVHRHQLVFLEFLVRGDDSVHTIRFDRQFGIRRQLFDNDAMPRQVFANLDMRLPASGRQKGDDRSVATLLPW